MTSLKERRQWMRSGCPVPDEPVAAADALSHRTLCVAVVTAIRRGLVQDRRVLAWCRDCGHGSVREVSGVSTSRFPDLVEEVGACLHGVHVHRQRGGRASVAAIMAALRADTTSPPGMRSAWNALSDVLANGRAAAPGGVSMDGSNPCGVTVAGRVRVEVHWTPEGYSSLGDGLLARLV